MTATPSNRRSRVKCASPALARRRILAALCAPLAAGFAGCAGFRPADASARVAAPPALLAPGESLVDAAGARVEVTHALAAMRAADFLLLGEVHDNPRHHALRAMLLEALAPRPRALVFEQLERGGDAAGVPPPELPAQWLDAVGFDRRAWGWPLHRPLFETALRLRLPVRGLGLSRAAVRRAAREGAAALPAALAEALVTARLAAAPEAALDDALQQGHCNALPAAALPGMRVAQRARDAAMALALLDAGAPAALIAGNGHVRRDFGVPQLLAAMRPGARTLSVGLLEREPDGSLPGRERLDAYDLVWVTAAAPREDPCARFAPR